MGLVSELRRRNVFRMAALYVVAAWLVMQVAEVIIGLANLPDWIGPTLLALLAIGFPIALAFSWFYELTPEGISLENDVEAADSIMHVTGRRVDFIIIALLCAAVLLFAYDKWWIGPPPQKSIAVLAFANMSGDPDQEYFSDGISEEILNLLAQLPELTVISRSSAFSFKGKDVPLPTIAEQLNVAHILEGSVRRAGDRVRITAQLIEARSDAHLWSKSFDRELDDIFAVQDEIAAAIGDALKVKLALVGGEAVTPASIKAANTAAYDAYLQGRELVNRRGRENMDAAARHFERALRLDENFAPAHAQLAIAKTLYGGGPMEARRSALAHLDRAQELEPNLAEAHAGRALLARLAGDYEAMVEHARKALASNPNFIDAMNWLAIGLNGLGRYEERDAIRRQLWASDPLSVIGRANYASWLTDRGRHEEAHEIADQLSAQSPWMGYRLHADAAMESEGKIAESLYWALQASANDPRVMWAFIWAGEYEEACRIDKWNLPWADLLGGRWEEAMQVTQENLRLNPDSNGAIRNAAEVLYYMGRMDEALSYYERLFNFAPEGRPIPGYGSLQLTMRLAFARRIAGDEEGAQAAARIARQDHAARRTAGERNQLQDHAEAMIAAFEHDPERVIAALKLAIQRGLRGLVFLDEPIFEAVHDEPQFVALREELVAILDAEHDKVLQLICFNNPISEQWQPMPETCESVVEQSSL
jgi:TolB-like protein/Tfp pilus assembly protein PilF